MTKAEELEQAIKAQTSRMFLQPWTQKSRIDHGTFTLEEFIQYGHFNPALTELIRYGDTDTLDRYLTLRGQRPQIASPVNPFGMTYELAGSFVDVGRFVTGEPESMVDFTAQPANRLIDVEIRGLFPHTTKEYTVLYYHGLLIDIVDMLELAGYRCRVSMRLEIISGARPEINACRVIIKEHDHPLDLAVMAALLMNERVMSRFAYARYHEFGDGWCTDYFREFSLTQTPESITLPSLYFQGNYRRADPDGWADLDLPKLMTMLKLDFLL